jgi:hypothetical protein
LDNPNAESSLQKNDYRMQDLRQARDAQVRGSRLLRRQQRE